jgi:LuxR family transcriptional regulator, maltose regulon positive regulatory protein
MPDEARETLAGFPAEPDRTGTGFISNARAVIRIAEGDPTGALDVLRGVPDVEPPAGPAFTLVETHLLAGIAHLNLGGRNAAAAATEAALTAAEPDRLIFPFAMTQAAELLDALQPDPARDRARALPLAQHDQHAHPQHLHQARGA